MSADIDSPTIRPTTPHSDDGRPLPVNRSSSSLSGLISRGAERVGEEWSEPLVLFDVIETFFDSRLDLWERRLKEQSAKLRRRAGELIPKGLRTPGGKNFVILDDSDDDSKDGLQTGSQTPRTREKDKSRKMAARYKADMEREVSRMKVKLAGRLTHLTETWRSAQIVRTREKVSFLFSVTSLAATCLIYGMAPDWIPFAYTVQCAFYLPVRVYTYKRMAWHYFLFDMCYFVNVMDLIWLWLRPDSTVLFICCYLLTMGPLASAIITWRNSLVFHSLDKVTSLFIHIYPPIVFSVILFQYDNAAERYPAITSINNYAWYTKILMAAVPYSLWQLSYFKFISVDRKAKIESGQRQNSFHYLLNNKRGAIGRALRGIRPEHRELWFIFWQLIYSVVFMIPAATLFIHSATATYIALTTIFLVSVWNGATFYVEVFGRKFERELERLRKEMEAMSSGHPSSSALDTPYADTPIDNAVANEVDDELNSSPLVLPRTAASGAMPELALPDTVATAVEAGLVKPKSE